MDTKHIAIVGCGFTGTSAFYQIVDHYPVREITIFEASGVFGAGYPYRSDECADYLMNNTTDTLCLTPDNRRAFLLWLQSHPAFGPDTDPRGNLPRKVFGAFLEDAFNAARMMAAVKGIKVTLVPHEATAMSKQPDGQVQVMWDAGEITADAALLSTGRCPDVDPYPSPPEGSGATYIANHVRTDAFGDVGLDATVHILGASLSSYDVINRLFSEDTGCRFIETNDGSLTFEPGSNARHVVLCSRSGRLKALQSQTPMKITRTHFTPDALAETAGGAPITLSDLSSAITQEAAAHGVKIAASDLSDPYDTCESEDAINARAGDLLDQAIAASVGGGEANFLVDLLSDAQIDLWDGWASDLLDPEAKAQYRRQFETAMLSYSAPCPITTARRLQALHKAGRLSIHKGVTQVVWSGTDDAYRIERAFGTDSAKVLVNTTGSLARDLHSPKQPSLVKALTDAGLLRSPAGPDSFGADVDMTTMRSKSAQNIYVANMMLWGPGFFTSSAFMMALVVERILAAVFSSERS